MNEDEVFERVAGSLAGMQTTQVMSVALNIMGSAIRNLAEGNHELADELYAVTCESLRRCSTRHLPIEGEGSVRGSNDTKEKPRL